MLAKCIKCGMLNSEDSLSPESECFDCSTGHPKHIDIMTGLRETLSSIVDTLAERTGELKKKVRETIQSIVKDDRNGGLN